jgi:hypothetical protein
MSEVLGKYHIQAFKAIDNPQACNRFFDGHTGVLTELGIKNLNSAQPSWMTDSQVYVLTATDEDDEVVAGLRIHRFTSAQQTLPLVDAIGPQDPKIKDVIEQTLPQGTAEACGLWSAKKVFGKGLTPLLCIAAIPVMRHIGLTNFFCFAAPYTEKMIKTNGLIEVEEVGDMGRLPYPTKDFISVVLRNPDIETMAFAEAYNRERVFDLIADPVQMKMESCPRGLLEVNYDLRLKKTPESALF